MAFKFVDNECCLSYLLDIIYLIYFSFLSCKLLRFHTRACKISLRLIWKIAHNFAGNFLVWDERKRRKLVQNYLQRHF